VPLLVIFGSADDLVDPESAQGFRAVPGARIVTLDGIGHSPHVEDPRATARLIEDFLASANARSR
jgi:pimeloyl-ACP methyl ester carboxylesterase